PMRVGPPLAAGATIPPPPTRVVAPATPFAPASVPSRLGGGQRVQSDVDEAIDQLSDVWRKRGFPPQDVCKLLEAIVFPEKQPQEIFLCDGRVMRDLPGAPSIGRALVEWAIRADRTDELQKQIAARRSGGADEMAGKVLQVQLAVASRRPMEAKSHLRAITQQLLGHRLPSLADI